MKLYTREGDDGSTGLFGGDRVIKSHPRLRAYGGLDELNSLVGILRLQVGLGTAADPCLERIQNDLFVLGARLATPPSRARMLEAKLSSVTWSIEAMEMDIDRLAGLASPMRNFVLPGGAPGAAWAHLARTVCRRAERDVITLDTEEPVDPAVKIYLNRLSDWFFALARAENAVAGIADVEWQG
jgi:cob(I)alamin adenosyltransferase